MLNIHRNRHIIPSESKTTDRSQITTCKSPTPAHSPKHDNGVDPECTINHLVSHFVRHKDGAKGSLTGRYS